LNRNRLITGAAVAVVVLLVLGAAGVALWRSKDQSRHTGHKLLIKKLGYCGSSEARPCINSFSQDGEGGMLVDILVPDSGFPNFYLTIYKETEGYLYECEEVEDLPNTARCVGREMSPGELMQFTLIAESDKRVLAQGQFAIIGLLLSTPVAAADGTPGVTEVPVEEEATPIFPGEVTPVASPTLPSYPNPGYPNP